MPEAPLTACLVRITLYTTRGWRPTSVVTQPAISATTESGPASVRARWNQSDFREPSSPDADREEDHAEERQQRPDPHHDLEGDADDLHRRPAVRRDGTQPLDSRVRVVMSEEREQFRDAQPVLDPVVGVPPSRCSGAPRVVFGTPSRAASLV